MLSMTTDYVADVGSPEPYLRQIADAGFSHVHWCHQWNTDHLYTPEEMTEIGRWLKSFGLGLLDLHGSDGVAKDWVSLREDERLAGVELVQNRIELAALLCSEVVVMHIAGKGGIAAESHPHWIPLRKSLDEIEPFARTHHVRLAVENMANDDFCDIRRLFEAYGDDYLGLCFDSGHGHIGGRGLDHLELLKHRLISVHLHDNQGVRDQHLLPFAGTVPWERLTRILATSSYAGCVSLESSMRESEIQAPDRFLQAARGAASTLTRMIEDARAKGQPDPTARN